MNYTKTYTSSISIPIDANARQQRFYPTIQQNDILRSESVSIGSTIRKSFIASADTIVMVCLLTCTLFAWTGCSQTILVTKQGDQFSGDNITYDQFNRLRQGKYFEMVMKDSSSVPITLIRAGIDSIVFLTGEEEIRQSVSTQAIAMLYYHQNDNGFNAMIGGFGGLLAGGAAAKLLFDFNDNDSSIKGFGTVIFCSFAGALIGYQHETVIAYSFPFQKRKKP